MSPIDGCLSWRSQGFTFSRRELFQKVAAVTLPFVVLSKPSVVPPLTGRPLPEFWFGERVSFRWVDENTGQPHSESGVVVGAVWNHIDQEWQYMVTWLSSTIDPDGNYPIFSEELVPEETLCKP